MTNVLYRWTYLNMLSALVALLGDTMESLGCGFCLEKEYHLGRWVWGFITPYFQFALSAFWVWLKRGSLSFLF